MREMESKELWEKKNGVQIHDHECGKPTQFEQKALSFLVP